MRRALCSSLMMVGLLLGGCTPFGKKQLTNNGAGPGPTADATPAPRIDQPDPPPPPNWTESQPGPVPGASGMLAGQVVDSYGRRPPAAFIQVVPAPRSEDPNPPAPIEVSTDPNGYFTILSLEAGRHYQLTARAYDGQRMQAGTTWATPPNPKVMIRISEDFTGKSTPPLPGAPAAPGRPTAPAPPPAWPDNPTTAGAHPAAPPAAATPGRAAELGAPIGNDDPPPAAVPLRPENITQDPSHPAPPMLQIRPQARRSDSPVIPTAAGPTAGPAPVPSCVLTGTTLSNFALNDLGGQPWEFRQHRGKLVLVDFWGSWCMPCRQAIPHLKNLQQTYGPYGLEVVGIAYEEGTPLQQAKKVEQVSQLQRINYRLLLGGDKVNCPVRQQFQVSSWPTLVLLDDEGHILARKEGLDMRHFHDIEVLIRQRLGFR